jgi:hypothetical protein
MQQTTNSKQQIANNKKVATGYFLYSRVSRFALHF